MYSSNATVYQSSLTNKSKTHARDKPLDTISSPASDLMQEQRNRSRQKMDKLVERSMRPLAWAKSVFPFDFFPDEISVDETKINIICREFFFSEDVHSVLIDLIKDVELQASLFFATLKVVPDGYPGKPIVIRYLKKAEAYKVRRTIQGLMISSQQGIRSSDIEDKDLSKKLERIGGTSGVG